MTQQETFVVLLNTVISPSEIDSILYYQIFGSRDSRKNNGFCAFTFLYILVRTLTEAYRNINNCVHDVQHDSQSLASAASDPTMQFDSV